MRSRLRQFRAADAVLPWAFAVAVLGSLTPLMAAEPARPFDVNLTLPDAAFVLYIRPAELAKAKLAEPIVKAFDDLLPPGRLGISVAELESFEFQVAGTAGDSSAAMTIRALQPLDWRKVFEASDDKEEEIEGRKYYKFGARDYLTIVDDRTAVYGKLETAQRLIEGIDANDRAEWADAWKQAQQRPLAGMLHMHMVAEQGGLITPRSVLAADAKYAIMHGEVTSAGLKLSGVMETESAEAAARAAPAAAAALVDFATQLTEKTGIPPGDQEKLAAALSQLLAGGVIATRGSSVNLSALVTAEMLEVFADTARIMAETNK